MPEPRHDEFQYTVLRVVPHVERGECVNAAVVLFCRRRGFLAARVGLDELARIAAGEPDAGAIAALAQSERFHWLAAPSSTVVQPSPVHTGFCDDPGQMLEHLFERLVA